MDFEFFRSKVGFNWKLHFFVKILNLMEKLTFRHQFAESFINLSVSLVFLGWISLRMWNYDENALSDVKVLFSPKVNRFVENVFCRENMRF